MCRQAFRLDLKTGPYCTIDSVRVNLVATLTIFLSAALTGPRPFRYLYRMGEYSLGDAIRHFLKHSRLNGSVQALQIDDIWEQIMGKTVKRYTNSIKIYGRKLYITTSVAPLKQELIYQKDSIIQRVNEALGEKAIDEVIIN